jgi:histidyl-tRNA synthetase
VFLVQIGYEAKLKSLQVIDELRRARIPVSQALAKDRLGAQLSEAQRLGVPYVLIMGQHEAVRDMVLIRNTETRSQDTVPITDLIPALRRHLSKK